jgi:hypothetical protein
MKSVPKKSTTKRSAPKRPSTKKPGASSKKPRVGDEISKGERDAAERHEKARQKMLNQYLTDMANTPPSQRAPIARTGPVSGGRSSLYSRLTGGLTNRGK